MLTNDILRKIRYSLDLKDKDMKQIFQAGDPSLQDIKLYTLLKKEDEKEFVLCSQALLNSFLNGLIIFYRGPSDKPPVPAPETLSNNDVLRKIRIALMYQEVDMLEVFKLSKMEISKSELTSFFRRKNHKHYQECGDQFLRYFLQGLSLYPKRPLQQKTDAKIKTGRRRLVNTPSK